MWKRNWGGSARVFGNNADRNRGADRDVGPNRKSTLPGRLSHLTWERMEHRQGLLSRLSKTRLPSTRCRGRTKVQKGNCWRSDKQTMSAETRPSWENCILFCVHFKIDISTMVQNKQTFPFPTWNLYISFPGIMWMFRSPYWCSGSSFSVA